MSYVPMVGRPTRPPSGKIVSWHVPRKMCQLDDALANLTSRGHCLACPRTLDGRGYLNHPPRGATGISLCLSCALKSGTTLTRAGSRVSLRPRLRDDVSCHITGVPTHASSHPEPIQFLAMEQRSVPPVRRGLPRGASRQASVSRARPRNLKLGKLRAMTWWGVATLR